MNKNMNEENKTLKIVFADTGGKNFNFYIEGTLKVLRIFRKIR